MKLEYVGPKPIVDQHGVDFDKSEPDRYIFLYATLELLEVIEECVNTNSCYIHSEGIVDISNWEGLDISPREVVALVKKHCDANLENIIDKREDKTKELIEELKKDVEDNQTLQEDEKTAWIGNIDIMTPYYMQFIENELVFECLLNVLAEDIYRRKIKEIKFNLGKNYGFVFSYLQNVLSEHNPPIDCDISVGIHNEKTIGTFKIKIPQKLKF
jgi:hypothetical protein